MHLKDKGSLKGYFSIQAFDENDKLIDEYGDDNMIMNTARSNMALSVAGTPSVAVINKLVLGTKGWINSILTPIEEGQNGFVASRTSLFSETGSVDPNYHIPFDTSAVGDSVSVNATGQMYDGLIPLSSDSTDEISVNRELIGDGKTLSFTFEIPVSSGNDSDGVPIPYTEAALYAGDDMFSMKTFPARVKEGTVKFIITWSIIF